MPQKVLKNGKAKEKAYAIIKDMIISSAIKPGEAVTEIAMSERLSLSRTPVREALQDLEKEGLIITRKGRKRVYMLTVREIEEIFDLKIEIESAVARWAAEKGTPPQFAKLMKTIQKMKKLAHSRPSSEQRENAWMSDWLKTDQSLHGTLYQMAGNRRAEQIVTNINLQWHQLRLGMLALKGRVEKSALEHESFILAVCEQKPAMAEKRMRTHLENLKAELLKLMRLFNYPLS